jgi:hypothetical protein
MVVAGISLSPLALAVKALYGVATDINAFLDRHIEEMKASDNLAIARTGRVLEMAKFGFGVGYITSVVVISAGQFLLGNTLAAMATVVTAATLTNPMAMTCAAFGAIYYGWGALSDVERKELLEKLSDGLEIGIEFIKSIISFVVEKAKEMLTSKNFEEMKKFVASGAALFGKSLGDVTHRIGDVVTGTLDVFKKKSGSAMNKTFEAATDACGAVVMTTVKVGGHVDLLRDKIGDVAVKSKDIASDALQTASSVVSETATSIQTTVIETAETLRKSVR